MKKILSSIICLCMLISILPTNVFAASVVNIFNITVTEPVTGEKPVNSGSVPSTASTEVVKVEWDGDFDDNGCFIEGNSYKVSVTVRIKAGQDKYIKYVKSTTKINGQLSEMKSLTEDKKQAVICYTFNVGSKTEGGQAGGVARDLSKAKYSELSVNEFEWEVLRLCNIERAKEGLDSLSMNGTLQDICDIREKELVTTFSHDRPDGSDCYSAIPSTYTWSNVGENIARGQRNPAEVVESWMNSPGHRANILNPEFRYMGVGYNSNGNNWVQFFSSSKDFKIVGKNSFSNSSYNEKISETDIKDVYLTITASNGYKSYMPVDFDSMKQTGGKYYPRLAATQNVSFIKVEDTDSETNSDKTTNQEKEPTVTSPTDGKTTDLTEGSLFGKYIPITHVYGTNFGVPYNMEAGSIQRFDIGTRFYDETIGIQPSFAPQVKRSDYQNHYVKISYLGTYGTVGKEIAVTRLGIIDEAEYDLVMNGKESDWAKVYNLTKDTIVISADIYDENKQFVRKLTPAAVIVATDASGNFITFSHFLGSTSTILYSQIDNFFAADEDKSRSSKSFSFVTDKIMLTNKADAEKLLPPAEIINYEYKSYPELNVTPNYNANHILGDEEFVTPDNVYYQVGVDFKQIDPVIKNEIRDVVSYSYYTHKIDTLYTQRNIVTADGTLYGVTSEYEKKKIATNVKKATANHYLTNSGEVKELSGKTVATDVYDYEESNDGWVIGIIKNDSSFYMGYTYIEGKDGYARGLAKMTEKVKCVVPNGLITNENAFWRWDNQINVIGIDENAFASGEVIQNYEMKLGIVKVCSNAERVFPYEFLTKIWAHSDENRNQNIYGFVQSKSGKLYGYSSTYHIGFNSTDKVERIFPVFSSNENGNFVGIKFENQDYINVIACRYCDGNAYRYGPLLGGAKYVCETLGGYYGDDGKVYGLEDHPPKGMTKDGITPFLCIENYLTNNPNMYRKTATYRAYSRDTDSNIPLLPNVYTWNFDSKRMQLLERTDGSVWMASVLHPSTNADLIAMTGGYESSNVFQVSQATKNKVDAEYFDVNGVELITTESLKFTDVADDAWYADSVKWAVDRGITTGTSATTFSPDNTCTRAQILTFMWRAVGSPKVSSGNHFEDVKEFDYYYDAARWAYEKGMVTGSKFEGDTPCTRSATVVYLWKNAGSPYTSYYGTFADVTAGSGFASAVAWAVENGVTSGTSETTFSPDMTCTRGQIVTFLKRALR